MHRLLERQLKKLGLGAESPPADPEQWKELLSRVSKVYEDADQERYLMERSLQISSREMLERWEALQESQRQVEAHQAKVLSSAKMASLGEMAGCIAHEINNPLTIIRGNAERILRVLGSSEVSLEEIGHFTGKIESTVGRISRIVLALRSFSRDGAQDPFVQSPVRAIVEETLEFCIQKLRRAQIDVRTQEIPADLMVSCRPVQISQVLLNLLNNAHDALEGREEKWIEVRVSDHGAEVEIAVSDSGPGIPPELREKVLQPFFTTKPAGKGTGLGLSVSRSIIESHGGSFGLDESPGATRFMIRLPKHGPG